MLTKVTDFIAFDIFSERPFLKSAREMDCGAF